MDDFFSRCSRCIVIENVRSAYNVGNIIRTADALGYGVILSGYSPSPFDDVKVAKTSLGAENVVPLLQFRNTHETVTYLQKHACFIVVSEQTEASLSLHHYTLNDATARAAIVVGNEKTGVLKETCDFADSIVHIPMLGYKGSMNVGQAAAIMMRALRSTL